MQTHIALSDSKKLTEYQFFRREFGIKISHVNPVDFHVNYLDSNEKVLVASTRPDIWAPKLKSLPKDSVIFFLLGNETYLPENFNALNDLPSIEHAFIYNPPTRVKSLDHWYALCGDLIDQFPNFTIRTLQQILRDNRTSRHLRGKFKQTQIGYSWSALPQGYSNSFVSGLVATNNLSANETCSLTDSMFASNLAKRFSKQRKFIFVGQKTNRRRGQVVDLLAKNHNSFVLTKETGFGGTTYDDDPTYVKLLLTSWFNVIPPGFFNNSNHRYTESCIAGTIPVILFHNSIDHSENHNWTRRLSPISSHSFKRIVDFLEGCSDSDLSAIMNSVKQEDFGHIWHTQRLIHQLLD